MVLLFFGGYLVADGLDAEWVLSRDVSFYCRAGTVALRCRKGSVGFIC